MKKSQQVLLFSSIVVPILICIPVICDLLFPKLLAGYFSLSYLFFIYILLFLCFGKNTVITHTNSNTTYSFFTWLGLIFLIQIILIALFLGQLFTLNQFELKTISFSTTNTTIWWNIAIKLLANFGLFPWVTLCGAVIFFNLASKQKNLHHLSAIINLPQTVLGKLFNRVIDAYLISGIRLFIALSIGLAGLQLSLIIFPSFSSIMTPAFGIVTCAILLMLTFIKPMQQLLQKLHDKEFSPIVFFLIQLFFISVVCAAMSVIGQHLHASPLFKPLHLFSINELPAVYHIWFFSWWLFCIPAVSSLLFFISKDKKIKTVILSVLFLPVILLILTLVVVNKVYATPIPIEIIYTLQSIGLIGLILLFKEKWSHHILWFGFLPALQAKKLRIVDLKSLWVLPPAVLALLALSGVQGLQVLFCITSFGILLTYLILIFVTRFKKA